MWPCRVCGGVQVDGYGYCTRCRNFVGVPDQTGQQTQRQLGQLGPPGLPPKPRPDRVPIVVIGIVVALALAVICCAGVGLFVWRNRSQPVSAVLPESTARPEPIPTRELTPAECLVGTWREASYVGDAEIDGYTIRLTGSGAIQRFDANGVVVLDMTPGFTKTGKRGSSTYTVTSKGTVTFHYQVIGGQIHYSSAKASGTTTWKRNGSQIDKQQLQGSIGAETFTCTGDKLTQYGETYSIELARVIG